MRKSFIQIGAAVSTGILWIASASAQTATAPKSQTATSTGKSTTASATSTTRRRTAVAHKPMTLTTDKDKTSYAIGMNLGKNLHRDDVDIDLDVFLQGVKDSMTGGKTLLTDDQQKSALMALQASLHTKQQAKMQQMAVKNKQEGDAFLAANKTKEGVVTLPSGLQYKILKAGTGPKPTASDVVVCNYRGTLIDNTEFDSSYKRGQPSPFGVSQVIKGWTEALQLMPTGSKWQIFVPSDLAYGARGAGQTIGPNATLIFEVELVSIQPKEDATPQTEAAPQTDAAPKGDTAPKTDAAPKTDTAPKTDATPQ